MKMSICTDAQGRVTGVCPDDLTGGTGWAWVETDLTPADNLCAECGTALYKCVDGVVCSRTAEEIAADSTPETTAELTDVEKLKVRTTVTEDAITAIIDMMMGV